MKRQRWRFLENCYLIYSAALMKIKQVRIDGMHGCSYWSENKTMLWNIPWFPRIFVDKMMSNVWGDIMCLKWREFMCTYCKCLCENWGGLQWMLDHMMQSGIWILKSKNKVVWQTKRNEWLQYFLDHIDKNLVESLLHLKKVMDKFWYQGLVES